MRILLHKRGRASSSASRQDEFDDAHAGEPSSCSENSVQKISGWNIKLSAHINHERVQASRKQYISSPQLIAKIKPENENELQKRILSAARCDAWK